MAPAASTMVTNNVHELRDHQDSKLSDQEFDKLLEQEPSPEEDDNGKVKEKKYKWNIVWRNVFSLSGLHIGGFYGLLMVIVHPSMPLWGGLLIDFYGRFFALGITAGSHRLWSHRSYKARLPLRIFLMILQTMALQDDIYQWVRDHRLHHKYSDTDADPYNASRGFFFSHMGWLLVRKHPEVRAKGKTIPMEDVWADPVVRFQRHFYIPLVIIFWGLLPTYLLQVGTGLSFIDCFASGVLFRYLCSLHHAWLVNSAAHLFGDRPYNKKLEPRENRMVVYASIGEGYHNYHHTFPYDYSASELGWEKNFNITTMFIDGCAWLGQAYDLRKPSRAEIDARVERTGSPEERSKLVLLVNTASDYIIGLFCSYFVVFFSFALRVAVNGKL